MLRHSKVRSIDLSEMDLVASLNKRIKQVEHKPPSPGGQKALDVLKKKGVWSMPCDEVREYSDERVALVSLLSPTGGREALARRSPCDHIAILNRG